jgi:DNA-binding NtrC family response regulator
MTPKKQEATVLIVDDVAENLSLLRSAIEPQGYKVLGATNGPDALRIAKAAVPNAILLDVMMPGMSGYDVCRALKADPTTSEIPVIFVTMKDDRFGLAEGFGVGGVDYISKPFEPEEVVLRLDTHLTLRRMGRDLELKNGSLEKMVKELQTTNQDLQDEIENRHRLETSLAQADEQISKLSSKEAARWGIDAFIGQSKPIEDTIDEIRKLQSVEKTSVLITGESGTGKELVARAIHYGGPNSKDPFVAVNCSAIPHELTESAFFGHVRGAFSGAHANQTGYFEQANGGTLFLDEIGDMPLKLQAKLLRVLETGKIQPIGSEKESQIRVRVLAATNQDLTQRIELKAFRQDLYFRLSGYTLALPPLRDRQDDILLLSQHFIGLLCAEMGRELIELNESARSALVDYSFPGNVRELKNIIEHALIKSGGGPIESTHLHLLQLNPRIDSALPLSEPDSGVDTLVWQENRERVIARAQKRTVDPNENGAEESGVSATAEEKILGYLKANVSISNTECRDLLGVDKNHASYLLRKLCSYGLLRSEGEKRWRRYSLALPVGRS